VLAEEFLQDLARQNEWFHYRNPNITSEEGLSLPYAYLTTDKVWGSSGFNKRSRQKLRIWFQGGVHGDEPAGDQGLLALLGKLSKDKAWARSVLKKADLVILPRYNPDGVNYFQREFVTNFDPNRDHAVLRRKQTQDIKTLLNEFDPHVFLDAHEYTANSPLGASRQWIKAQDVQVSAVKNPNIHEDIRHLQEGLFINTVYATIEQRGLRTSPYFVASSGTDTLVLQENSSISHAGHNSAGLGQRISFLTETRGIRLGDQHFQRRVFAGLLAAETILRTAIDNAELVYRTIEDARADFLENDDDIIVLDKSRPHSTTWEFIDARNGSLVDVPVTFNNNTPSETVLSRSRPEAYIFSSVWKDVAERLEILGVDVDVLKEDFEGEVGTLTVTEATLAQSKFHGIVQTAVRTESGSRNVRIPAGGFRVDTRQKNALYALVTLEPENTASFVTYNIIPLDVGDEYPVFRI
jgi:hypothetical protein